jgi:orotate phosphoribosyltransferase
MSVSEIAAELLKLATERRALTFGDYVLSSGQHSSYYFDGRRLTLDPQGAYLTGKAFFGMLQGFDVDAIGGPTLGADPIVTAVALISGLEGRPTSAFIVRKEGKAHGMGRMIEGPLEPGSRVAIVDDACSTGASLFHAVDAAEAEGHEVVVVLAILDRRQGGTEELLRRGYDFRCLLEATPEGEIHVTPGLDAGS